MVRFLIDLINKKRKEARKRAELRKIEAYKAPVLGSQINKWKEVR